MKQKTFSSGSGIILISSNEPENIYDRSLHKETPGNNAPGVWFDYDAVYKHLLYILLIEFLRNMYQVQ